MTLQEILKAKGLDDEAVESVIGEMKQNKIFTSAEENIDIRYGKLKKRQPWIFIAVSQFISNAVLTSNPKTFKIIS